MNAVTVTGPTTTGTRPNAFGSPVVDLGEIDYVEEEFFIDGEATAYEPAPGQPLSDGGRWEVRPSRTAPFKTRMLVLRPRHAEAFSGTVWVSWLNVTAGFEVVEAPSGYLRDGDVLAYVSAQKAGLDGYPGAEANGLCRWDPERYGSLTHPGDDFSYDIFTKAARLVGRDRGDLAADPLRGLAVERVLACGTSQSAFRLASYLNGVHPIEHAVDGALLMVSFGWAAPFETPPGDVGLPDRSTFASTPIRNNLEIPVLLLTTETEAESLYPVRQPDTDRFRTWEIAGGAHASGAGGLPPEVVEVFVRDELQPPEGAALPDGSTGVEINTMRWLPVTYAARRHVAGWAAGGAPPPSFPLIEFAGDPPSIRRDEYGNARGGIRIPELEVPVATYRGTLEGAELMASLFGSTTPFPPEQLTALYPSRDAYLGAYDEAVDRGIAAGYVLAEDADDVKAWAAGHAATLFPE